MEECILIQSTIGGMVVLDHLPETMRFLYIQHSPSAFEAIVVDYRALPASLEDLHVTSVLLEKRLRAKVTEIGRAKKVRLKTRYDGGVPMRRSKYYAQFAALR